ncbi:unnamed protein product [Leptidea sinapis]|uniref:Uncharacterized protein n=1 Tax=Leptidea sinapis TaxID=189913 RepID=A0A5E4R5I8_9NEOP|nr:unnamed protein product [Leptidea sinapis]
MPHNVLEIVFLLTVLLCLHSIKAQECEELTILIDEVCSNKMTNVRTILPNYLKSEDRCKAINVTIELENENKTTIINLKYDIPASALNANHTSVIYTASPAARMSVTAVIAISAVGGVAGVGVASYFGYQMLQTFLQSGTYRM